MLCNDDSDEFSRISETAKGMGVKSSCNIFKYTSIGLRLTHLNLRLIHILKCSYFESVVRGGHGDRLNDSLTSEKLQPGSFHVDS